MKFVPVLFLIDSYQPDNYCSKIDLSETGSGGIFWLYHDAPGTSMYIFFNLKGLKFRIEINNHIDILQS
jgi:hypothetical protein